jgi:hypothetical protein
MAVPEETRIRLSRWCAARIPDAEREQRQIGYTIHGREVTIVDRRPPPYPELGAEWSAVPIAQLRRDDPEDGSWSLYRPAEGGSWQYEATGDDPLVLLDRVRD